MFNVETDGTNKYHNRSRDFYLELAGDWVDELPSALVTSETGRHVWDDSQFGIGTKGRWGDLFVQRCQSDHLVYVAPRVGWAGISLTYLAAKYDKKLTLFMPASKRVSEHQLICIERGAVPQFRRIAAMPVLNKYAQDYAHEVGATFIPFGLDHELVVAAGVKSCEQHFGEFAPDHILSVVSTGTLTRVLQIAFPNAEFYGVAVARNMHDGEVGRAHMVSYDLPFLKNARRAKELSAWIDSAWNYDMKGFEMLADGKIPMPTSNSLVWNVAGEIHPENPELADEIDSQREWGEVR